MTAPTFSRSAPTRSPDPNRRRCRQCHGVDSGLVAVGQPKMSGTLWSWYHDHCVPEGHTPYLSSQEVRCG